MVVLVPVALYLPGVLLPIFFVIFSYALGLVGLLVVIILLAVVLIVPFGLDLALLHVSLNVIIETAPPGSHQIYQYRGRMVARRKTWWFWLKVARNHSMSYEHPHTIGLISNGMKRLQGVT